MAVVFDNVASNSSVTVGAGSLTWSHTVAATATLLLVGVSADALNNPPAAGYYTCTAGGVSMTQPASSPVNNANGSGVWIFQLLSPPTGPVSIVVTNAGGTNTNTTDALIGGSLSFTGSSTLGVPVTVVSGSGAALTLTVTGVAATSMVAAYGSAGDDMNSPSPGASRFLLNILGSGGNTDGNMAGATNTGTGSVAVTWGGMPSGDSHAGWAVEIQAAPTSGAGSVFYPRPSNRVVTQVFASGRMGAGHSR